jgi:uncharacterized protein (TIGR02246 family)
MREIDELRAEVRRLTDREAIRDVFTRYAAAMDTHDLDALEQIFAPDAVVSVTRRTPDNPIDQQWTGRSEILATMTTALSRHDLSQHIITNHQISLNGDHARAIAYLHSVHIPDANAPREHEDHGAWYLTELTRTAGGWQIARLHHTANWYAANMHPAGPIAATAIAAVRDYLPG